MFFCAKCAKKNNWPTSYLGSYGPCEVCRAVCYCNDIPSRNLKWPKQPTIVTLKVSIPAKEREPESIRFGVDNAVANHGYFDAKVEFLEED